jgi:hypothetical protein
LPKPQFPGVPGAQLGTGIALVLPTFAVGALAYELAIAPVTARATTRLRTMSFMVVAPKVFQVTAGNRIEDFSGRARWINIRISNL